MPQYRIDWQNPYFPVVAETEGAGVSWQSATLEIVKWHLRIVSDHLKAVEGILHGVAR